VHLIEDSEEKPENQIVAEKLKQPFDPLMQDF